MKKMWIIISIAVFIGGGWWVWKILSTPAPGQNVPDMGRDHVSSEQIANIKYNSNPPTSGPHLETWVKPGMYTSPQSEGELIHSLEHGYVIISYKCVDCETLQTQLESLAKRKKLFKLIVVPRPQLDTTIALTAWGAIDKFDSPAGGFDEQRIERFIDYYRDHGPEKTME